MTWKYEVDNTVESAKYHRAEAQKRSAMTMQISSHCGFVLANYLPYLGEDPGEEDPRAFALNSQAIQQESVNCCE